MAIAQAALSLGAGRRRAEDGIDPSVGFSHLAQSGDPCSQGSCLAVVHAASTKAAEQAREQVLEAIRISSTAPEPRKLIAELIGA